MARPYGPVVAGMLAILVASCDGSGHDRQSLGSPLKFDNAWVRVPVAGRTVTAAYCDVINPGDMPVDIVGFETNHPGLRVEIHESIEHDGMMQMRRLARVTIPAKATVSFAPGGKHLMLFGFDGSAADVTLAATLAGGGTLPVVFATRPE
ncbi:MAG: copper chaperone PCu(A)C [Gammaproteobacteria bacterium]|nr:copper chaperone PCu(A)C [Gammaproteobacteria bacterium]MDE0443330.1 copper chaperone PCu(A)C [Gammaproteobacteria bacterium]